jgi:AcrR family transcriptional regulator
VTATRGRPRLPGTDAAIGRATLDVLADVGYAGLTIDAVATQAGVSRPTVYRRHSTKAELVAAAVATALASANPAVPDTGDVATDVEHLLRNTIAALTTSTFGAAVAEIVGPARHETELRQLLDVALEERRGVLRAALGRAALEERLSVPDVEVAIDLLLGAVYLRLLVTGAAMEDTFVAEIVRAVVVP